MEISPNSMAEADCKALMADAGFFLSLFSANRA